MSNPVQVNMYGIRYFIDGDLSDPHVKKLMVQARNDLQQMKGRNINNIPHIWLNKPNAYKIVSQFGIDSAYINVPTAEEKKLEEEKKGYKIKTWKTYTFVPAICIHANEEPLELMNYYVYWMDFSDISVCASGDWSGIAEIIRDMPESPSPTVEYPSQKCKDGSKTVKREIIACTNWGCREFYHTWDQDDSTEVNTVSDTEFNPAPYMGRSSDGAIDHAWEDLTKIDTVYYYVLGTPGAVCSAVEAAIDDCSVDGFWSCTGYKYVFGDGYTVHYIDYGLFTCQDDWWKNTYLPIQTRCGSGHLFFEYQVKGYQEHLKAPGVWGFMGICFGYGSTYCYEHTDTDPVPLTQKGSAQNRVYSEVSSAVYYLYTDDDLQRSEGEIEPDRAIWPYGREYDAHHTAIMSAPCETSQSDSLVDNESYPQYENFAGAYIMDFYDEVTGPYRGDETWICPVSSFHNKYFLNVVERIENYSRTANCNPWNVSGYGYEEGGNYNHGSIASCTDTEENVYSSDVERCGYYLYAICLNGDRYEIDVHECDIDTGDDRHYGYFEITDTAIYDFRGTPVYMYAYTKYWYDGAGYYFVEYTRYGYFLNDVHYQSQKFYPAGVWTDQEYSCLSCLHDVYGSADKGQYGYGQLAGYMIKETFEERIEIYG